MPNVLQFTFFPVNTAIVRVINDRLSSKLLIYLSINLQSPVNIVCLSNVPIIIKGVVGVVVVSQPPSQFCIWSH